MQCVGGRLAEERMLSEGGGAPGKVSGAGWHLA